MKIFTGILTLLAGCGVFMVGIKTLIGGFNCLAGKRAGKLISGLGRNRVAGVCIGAAATAAVQSSTATTVMTISLVASGVMTLMQAAAVIMGANIGTCVTAFIVSAAGSGSNAFFSALAFVGVVASASKKSGIATIGEAACGLGLLFIGMDTMSTAFADESIASVASVLFSSMQFPPLLVLVGALFTAVVQSSSAVTGVLVAMSVRGVIRVESALFLVLGTNIGTCVTALIAAGVTCVEARRAAFFHFAFNAAGTLIFMPLVWLFPTQVKAFLALFGGVEWQIAVFHLLMNVVTTIVALPCLRPFVTVVERVIKDKRMDGIAVDKRDEMSII